MIVNVAERETQVHFNQQIWQTDTIESEKDIRILKIAKSLVYKLPLNAT